jgi:Fe-S-cluster containining protein
MTAVPDGLSTIHQKSDDWFVRARASLLGALPCRPGCCRCCHGPFGITRLDAVEIQRGLATLDPSVREDIQLRAARQAGEIESAFPALRQSVSLDGWPEADLDDLAERFRDLPCPALHEDGSCRVYGFRPVTCRLMGIPVESDQISAGACEVQTAVPIRRLPHALREEEDRLAEQEAAELRRRGDRPECGEELLLPYGFLGDRLAPP